ncbi:inorganic phosphate transporter [Candidatus Gottesmanbacteria bacterium]|nr:inorganic phosphate transporter [Candidatus Gottesmanbacteria bacterium]
MEANTLVLIFVLFLILWAEFVNGATDAPNAIATVVSTRVLSPKKAVLLATTLNIIGSFSGTAVAATIGKGIVRTEAINLYTVGAAMIGIIVWSSLAWKYGLPTSESHALISGLAGAGLASGGPNVLLWDGWQKVIVGLFFSTFLGFALAYIIFVIIAWIFRNTGISRVRRIFGRMQLLSAAFMAFSHGSNDGQKFIGAFSLALLLSGITKEFIVPSWVILLCAAVMGIGTSIGGWRIIKTMGMKLTKLEPQHGFAAETAAATAIEIATRFGIPLSTTHTINTSIMGVGSVQSLSKVRWLVASNIVIAWILTFPICGLISFILAKIFLSFG